MKKRLKSVPKSNKGLKKLPTPVRNKMGFMKKGGMVKGYKKGGSVSRGQYPVQTTKVKFKGVY